MSALHRQSLLDDIGNCSQFMNSAFSPQSQLKSLEKKIKIKSESVINNLNCLRKRGTAKDYDVFEKDKFNECLNEQMEVSDILSYEKRENVNINESIQNTSKLREHLNFKQAIIDKCLKSSSTQRNENLIKLFDNASKKYDELLSLILQNESREEIARVQETINDTEIEIPEIEKEISGAEIAIFAMEQSEEEIDKELEQDKEQMSLYKDNEKELKKIKKDLDSSTKELQVKNYSAAEQENSIADINKTNNDLIRKCEELIASKIKLQDNAQLLEIESENLSTLITQVTNKAEIFRLESDEKFLDIFKSEEYVESKSKLESIMNDNATMMKELQSLHTSDESITASINETKRELKVNEEELAEMEINKKAFEKQLHRENENLQNGLLKAQSEDQKTIRIIQQLRNEAENLRMEELYEQDTFSSNKIQWNQKIKEEQNKLKELKKKETTMETTTIREEESELWLNANHSRSSEQSAQNFTARNKRKSISSHSNKIAKQMKPNTDDEDSDDDDNEFNITFNTDIDSLA